MNVIKAALNPSEHSEAEHRTARRECAARHASHERRGAECKIIRREVFNMSSTKLLSA